MRAQVSEFTRVKRDDGVILSIVCNYPVTMYLFDCFMHLRDAYRSQNGRPLSSFFVSSYKVSPFYYSTNLAIIDCPFCSVW